MSEIDVRPDARRVRAPAVAVVGGGISGLAAAHAITSARPEVRVAILEASPQLGGKVRTSAFTGLPVEEGPDLFLARSPHAVDLCRRVGLGDDLVAPRTAQAFFWSGGRMRPIPSGVVLGVPSSLASVASSGILSAEGVARASLDLVLPKTYVPGDISVAALMRARFGLEVLDRLVEPMMGGVYAGDVYRLSAAATMPDVYRLARSKRSVMAALRARRASAAASGPVFLTVRGGLGRLVDATVSQMKNADVRTGVRADVIARGRTGYVVRTPQGVPFAADAVVLATPARAAAALLREIAPHAATELDRIEYADVATVALAYRRTAFPAPLSGNGFLVPRVDRRFVVGCTFMSSKWAHLAAGRYEIVRCAVGRAGDRRWTDLDEAEVVARCHADLADAIGVGETPVEARVTRWPGSMPQYTVGHPARLERIDAALAGLGGIALAGAGYRGIGLPSCIAQGADAAARVLRHLESQESRG